MATDAKARLQEIINAYIDKDAATVVDTSIVSSHLAQMKLFGIRQGIEFFPSQDNFGSQRKDFIDRVLKYNQLDTSGAVAASRLFFPAATDSAAFLKNSHRHREHRAKEPPVPSPGYGFSQPHGCLCKAGVQDIGLDDLPEYFCTNTET